MYLLTAGHNDGIVASHCMTSSDGPFNGRLHRVVVNVDGAYSLWPADRDLPTGWSDAGVIGTKEQCLEAIKALWTDMRPASVRSRTDGTR